MIIHVTDYNQRAESVTSQPGGKTERSGQAMTIITSLSEIVTTEPHELAVVKRSRVAHLPLSEFILLALAACGSESENTGRAYGRAWGDFLAYVSDVWGLPLSLARSESVLRPDGKMNKTVWVYAGDTRAFAKITPSLRDGYIKAMVAGGLSRATRSQRKNAVNTLLAIAFRDGFISPELATRLDVGPYKKHEKNNEQPVGRRLSKSEVGALRWAVTQARNDHKRYRDTAILDLMLFAALRRDEVANLTTGNLAQDGGRWWLVLRGKGDKPRRVKVHDTLYKSLAAWAQAAGLELGKGNEPLFCNLTKSGQSTGKALNTSVVGRLVGEYGSLAGLAPAHGENALAAHDLRRTCARNAYDNGATLLQVQGMLGHSDPKTTTRYIGALENDDETAVDHVHY